MCYSAQIWAAWRKFERMWHVGMSIKEFADLYINGTSDMRLRIPKAMAPYPPQPPPAEGSGRVQ